MMYKSNIILLTLVFGLVSILFSCGDQAQEKKKVSAPKVVSKTISQPVRQPKPQKENKKEDLTPKSLPLPEEKAAPMVSTPKVANQTKDRYDSAGKIDPFRPLIQEKPEERSPVVDARPKRILTPLEKIDLSQIRLVAVIIMKGRQIAMVEEASGKGYEVGIGTYMGKNQGRVSEIKSSSIVVKELVKDYKGKLKERVKEIKLHKNDNEE